VKCARNLLGSPIRDGNTSMLTQMFRPRFDDKGFDEPARRCGVVVETPPVSAVAQSLRT